MRRKSKKIIYILFIWLIILPELRIVGQEKSAQIDYLLKKNVLYRDKELEQNWTEYMNEKCRLDLYYPENQTEYPTVVWFHGGGLRQGKRYIPDRLKEKGIAVVAVSYRLHPKVTSPVYIDDAAAAVAWVFKNIMDFGGDQNQVYVAGHSAGGYLTAMVGLDKTYLSKYGVDANDIAGLIPFSGQTVTHSTIRAERTIPKTRPIVDEMAPLYHVRGNAPPVLLITGDRKLEIPGRYEENAYMASMMKLAGHTGTVLYQLEGFNHRTMGSPAFDLLLPFIKGNHPVQR